MPESRTTNVSSETSVSGNVGAYREHETYPASSSKETSQSAAFVDNAYVSVHRRAISGEGPVKVTINAGSSRKTVRIVRANRRLAKVQEES